MENSYGFAFSAMPFTGEQDNITHGSRAVASGLAHLLDMTRKLCRQSLYCHWQAAESEAYNLNPLFGHQYQALRKAADALSGRLQALGYELAQHAAWGTGADDTLPLQEMIASILKGHQACAMEAKSVLGTADATGDDITAHLAQQRLAYHDQAAWLLLTFLSPKSAIHSAV